MPIPWWNLFRLRSCCRSTGRHPSFERLQLRRRIQLRIAGRHLLWSARVCSSKLCIRLARRDRRSAVSALATEIAPAAGRDWLPSPASRRDSRNSASRSIGRMSLLERLGFSGLRVIAPTRRIRAISSACANSPRHIEGYSTQGCLHTRRGLPEQANVDRWEFVDPLLDTRRFVNKGSARHTPPIQSQNRLASLLAMQPRARISIHPPRGSRQICARIPVATCRTLQGTIEECLGTGNATFDRCSNPIMGD